MMHEPDLFANAKPVPWNKGRLLGPKLALKPKHIWSIRIHLEMEHRVRDLALFNMAIDSKLRGCDLVALRLIDITLGNSILPRAMVVQHKTGWPVQFEITEPARIAVRNWLDRRGRSESPWLFPSRCRRGDHISTRQYGRLLDDWVKTIGLDPAAYGTHSLRRTKVALLYKRTGNLRACQILLGHTKLESTVRYLGVEVDDALALSEATEV
jgi:integrase